MNVFEVYFGHPFALLFLLPAVIIPVLSYLRIQRKGMRNIRWSIPLIFRLIASVMAVLILADFSVLTTVAPISTIILADCSDSVLPVSEQIQKDAELLAQKTGGTIVWFSGEKSANNATNLSIALQKANAQFPINQRRRLIVLSDGIETDGYALKQAAALANLNTQIDAIQYAAWDIQNEVEVVSIDMPKEMTLGESTKANVTLFATADTALELSLYEGEELLYSTRLNISAGKHSYTISATPTHSGIRVFKAVAAADQDVFFQNNEAVCCVNVIASNKILLIDGTGKEGNALAKLLRQNGYDVEVTKARSAPPNVTGMCKYGLVIVMNADTLSLPTNIATVLNDYVSKYGRSVLFTGGENTYAFGHMHETEFESFLPVNVQVKDEESAEPVALLLIIDNSASMGESTTNMAADQGRPIEMAKLGAIKCISLLHDNDYAGVISFSTQAHLLCELQPAAKRDAIIASVSRMGTISGTMYTEAFQEAIRQFAAFEQPIIKHIIFLSDGNPTDDDYMPFVEQLAEMGVTISTISVGSYVSDDILDQIATTTGGRFVQVNSISDLPNLMISDTLIQQVDYLVEEQVTPIRSLSTSMFGGLVLPDLAAYIRVEAKNEAETVLLTENDHPLYVQWDYGMGRVGCFMSDLSGVWSKAWLEEESGQQAIGEMIDTLMPEEQGYQTLNVTLNAGGQYGVLSIQSAEPDNGENFEMDVIAPDGSSYIVHLLQVDAGVFEKSIQLCGLGKYDLTLRHYDAAGELIDVSETAVAIARTAEYEMIHTDEEKQLLEKICRITGGCVYEDPSSVLSATLEHLIVDYDPTALFAVTLLLAFFIEQILRHKPNKYGKRGHS